MEKEEGFAIDFYNKKWYNPLPDKENTATIVNGFRSGKIILKEGVLYDANGQYSA